MEAISPYFPFEIIFMFSHLLLRKHKAYKVHEKPFTESVQLRDQTDLNLDTGFAPH